MAEIIIGALLLLIPIVVLFIMIINAFGLKEVLFILGVAALFICLVVGMILLSDGLSEW